VLLLNTEALSMLDAPVFPWVSVCRVAGICQLYIRSFLVNFGRKAAAASIAARFSTATPPKPAMLLFKTPTLPTAPALR
jgi:hypothetical protein